MCKYEVCCCCSAQYERMRKPLQFVRPGRRKGGSRGQEEVGCDSKEEGPSLLCVTCGYSGSDMTRLNMELEQTT